MRDPIWRPTAERAAKANMTKFMRAVERAWNVTIPDYSALHDFSLERPDAFWSSVWDFCELVSERRGDLIVRDLDRLPGASWFPDARLNLAENLLKRRDDAEAIVFLSEDRARGTRRTSFSQLYDEVSRVRQALESAGVGPGDRVAGFLPNLPEAVIAMLAVTSLGAIWCACSPDFGINATVDRLAQVDATLLFAADGYPYNGRFHDSIEKVGTIASKLPTLKRVVVVSNAIGEPSIGQIPNAVTWDQFLGSYTPQPIEFQRFPFDHPAFILYSSGTTGAPKCIVHGAGGSLIENLKGQMLHFDVKPGDRIFWWTTTGWVVWHFMVFSLGCGATIILYDGSPTYPTAEVSLEIAARERITFLRLSPKLVETMAKSQIEPAKLYDLSSLKTITAAGAPFSPDGYEFIYKRVKQDVHLASPSGGTDPMASIVTGNPLAAVYPGEIQVRALGFKIEVFDDQGASLRDGPGELVITMPFPSMPLGFWNDPGHKRFFATYFNVYPNTWHQGDWAELTPRGGVIIHGRSDATLNARGVRIGTAEIYRQVQSIGEIADSVVVGHESNESTRVVLFVQLRGSNALSDRIISTIRERISVNASPRHVPDRIIQVTDIPRTSTGKVSEMAVREAFTVARSRIEASCKTRKHFQSTHRHG